MVACSTTGEGILYQVSTQSIGLRPPTGGDSSRKIAETIICRLGYVCVGDEFDEEGAPHQRMEISLYADN